MSETDFSDAPSLRKSERPLPALDASDAPTLRKLVALAQARAERLNTASWKLMNTWEYKRDANRGRDSRNRALIDGARDAATWIAALLERIEEAESNRKGGATQQDAKSPNQRIPT